MNVVVLIGRMVADPELKYTPSGVAVCQLRMAVDRWKKSDTGEKESDFFDIVAWQQRAEYAANYLVKGQMIAVHGRLQSRSWVQQDGQKRWKTEVVADQLQGLQRPQGAVPGGAPPPGDDYAPSGQSAGAPSESADTDMDYDPFAEE